METNTVRLYAFGYTDWKTYLWTAVFIVCNMLLPQLAHLIPQGGIIFAPLSFVILSGSYKFGWKAGLLAAVLSPVVNHLVFGMPEWAMAQVMVVKLSLLALLAGWAALRFQKANLLLLAAVVMASFLLGAVGEVVLTGKMAGSVADLTIGWPGLLLQVFGTYALLHYLARK